MIKIYSKLLCKKSANRYIIKDEYYQIFQFISPHNNQYEYNEYVVPIRKLEEDFYFNYYFTKQDINNFFFTKQELRKEKLKKLNLNEL